MNLREGWIGKKRAPFVSAIGGCNIGAARVRREIKYVAISTRGEHDRVCHVPVNVS